MKRAIFVLTFCACVMADSKEPGAATEPPTSAQRMHALLKDADAVAHMHQRLSTQCFNACWTYIEKPERTPADVENMLLLANASLWHWQQRPDCQPKNLAIGYWQLGRVHCLAGNTALAVQYGEKCVALAQAEKLGPFSLGYGYEVLADAAARDRRRDDADRYLKLAREQAGLVKEEFDRGLLTADLDRIAKLLAATK
jgi:hypothetical protein